MSPTTTSHGSKTWWFKSESTAEHVHKKDQHDHHQQQQYLDDEREGRGRVPSPIAIPVPPQRNASYTTLANTSNALNVSVSGGLPPPLPPPPSPPPVLLQQQQQQQRQLSPQRNGNGDRVFGVDLNRSLSRSRSRSRRPPPALSASPTPSNASSLAGERIARLSDAQLAELSSQVSAEAYRRRTPVGALLATYDHDHRSNAVLSSKLSTNPSAPFNSSPTVARIAAMSNEKFAIFTADLDAEAVRRDIPGIYGLQMSSTSSSFPTAVVEDPQAIPAKLIPILTAFALPSADLNNSGGDNNAVVTLQDRIIAEDRIKALSDASFSVLVRDVRREIADRAKSRLIDSNDDDLRTDVPVIATVDEQQQQQQFNAIADIAVKDDIDDDSGTLRRSTLNSSGSGVSSAQPPSSSAAQKIKIVEPPSPKTLIARSSVDLPLPKPVSEESMAVTLLTSPGTATITKQSKNTIGGGGTNSGGGIISVQKAERRTLFKLITNIDLEALWEQVQHEVSRRQHIDLSSGSGHNDDDDEFAAANLVTTAVAAEQEYIYDDGEDEDFHHQIQQMQKDRLKRKLPVAAAVADAAAAEEVTDERGGGNSDGDGIPTSIPATNVIGKNSGSSSSSSSSSRSSNSSTRVVVAAAEADAAASGVSGAAATTYTAAKTDNAVVWRGRILKLSNDQLAEVTADVYDEIRRRKEKNEPFLPARADLAVKRNEARKELSKLPAKEVKTLWRIIRENMGEREM
ncbi:hypothetical protein HK100_010590, partial [Physocladia obscura]